MELTKQNILEHKVANICTWPLIAKKTVTKMDGGNSKTSEKRDFLEEYKTLFAEMPQIIEHVTTTQKILLSWLLAVTIGVLGNLMVNLFFGYPHFEISNLPIGLLIATTVIIVILVSIIFEYQHGGSDYYKSIEDDIIKALCSLTE